MFTEVLTMTSAFQDLIKNTTLTKKESQIADYVLNNFREVCFMTSTELAEKLQISHSSVIRFTKDLGYSGYTEFQRAIRAQYNDYIDNHSDAPTIPTVKLTQSLEKLTGASIREAVYETTCNNLQSVIMHSPSDLFENASDAIIAAQSKYIVGSRGLSLIHISRPPAHTAIYPGSPQIMTQETLSTDLHIFFQLLPLFR